MAARRNLRLALPVTVLIILSACGGPGASAPAGSQLASASAGTGSDTIVVATVMPFTGENAAYGPEQLAGCYPFAAEVEEAGGVLGAMVECTTVDTSRKPRCRCS
jgi:ABC-type branched-subunit amino acid transport system substrate-binding protein